MKIYIFLTFMVVLSLTACGTFQFGIEYTPAGTTTVLPSPTNEITPTVTPFQPSPTLTPLPPTETPVASDITPGPQMVQMFLIAVGDNGQSGQLVGCGDSLVPVQIEIPPSQGVLRASLEALLSLKTQYYGQSGLYNALYQSNLQVESVTVGSGKAVIKLTGTLTLGGECDNPRVTAQLEATAKQFPTVTDVSIYINGKPLSDVISLKG
ncbi:MAG: GerMN domain-containing protein [Anaerolineales bacterium]|jgi:hypothetical protein